MPTYEYRCLDCNELFQAIEHIDDHGTTQPVCPVCKGTNVMQVFTSVFVKTARKS
jgi:putative FmdB family regulatory protein